MLVRRSAVLGLGGVLILSWGCKDDDTATPGGGGGGETSAGPTWHGEVAPLLTENCGACHVEGGLGSFLPLLEYDVAAPLASVIAERTASRAMPPFMAENDETCENPWGFLHDTRLSDADLAVLADWAAAGAPEGDAATAAPLPEPPAFGLTDWTAELMPPVAYATSVENGADEFICVTMDLGLTETGYLTGIEVVPDFDEVVHHATVFIDKTASTAALGGEDGLYPCLGGTMGTEETFIAAWVPGAAPTTPPAGAAWEVPAGARLVVQLHYHPSGVDQLDQTRYRLRWADAPPEKLAYVTLIGNNQSQASDGSGLQPGADDPSGEPAFFIPAESADHTELIRYDIPDSLPPSYVWFALNHMHYIGTGMKVWVEHAEGGEDSCLLNTPRWDFSWQQAFYYDAASGNAPLIQGGDTLWLECTYNNTTDNPALRDVLAESGLDEPQDVTLGEGSLDEMCITALGIILAD